MNINFVDGRGSKMNTMCSCGWTYYCQISVKYVLLAYHSQISVKYVLLVYLLQKDREY